MKKASNILYLLGGIFSLLAGAGYLVFAIMGFANALPGDLLTKIMQMFSMFTKVNTLLIFAAVLGGIAIVMSILGFLAIVYNNKSNKKGYHILMLVFTVLLHFDIFYLIASILGIADNRPAKA